MGVQPAIIRSPRRDGGMGRMEGKVRRRSGGSKIGGVKEGELESERELEGEIRRACLEKDSFS